MNEEPTLNELKEDRARVEAEIRNQIKWLSDKYGIRVGSISLMGYTVGSLSPDKVILNIEI